MSAFENGLGQRVKEQGRRGLVVFPGALGDFLCFLPTLRWVGERHPALPLELVMRSDFSELVFHREPPVTVRSLDCHEIGRFFSASRIRQAGAKASLHSYDFIYSWLGSGNGDFERNLATQYSGELRLFPFHPRDRRVHVADHFFSGVATGCATPATPAIPVTAERVAWRRRFWAQHGLEGKKVLALAPGSGARSKNWPISHFQSVARWWQSRTGGESLVLWGPVEEDRIADPPDWEEAHLVRGLSLGHLAALLAGCDLYLGNDSGLSHLAAALEVPTAVLFGPTDPLQFAPRGKQVWNLSAQVDCAPCGLLASKDCGHRQCLTSLSSERVTGLLESMAGGCLLDKV